MGLDYLCRERTLCHASLYVGCVMKRLLVIALLFAGCSSAPAQAKWDGSGVVTARTYDDPDDWDTQGTCAYRDDKGNCWIYNTDHHHDGPHWWVQVTTPDGKEHQVEMTETDYNKCPPGRLVQESRCLG